MLPLMKATFHFRGSVELLTVSLPVLSLALTLVKAVKDEIAGPLKLGRKM